MRKAFLLLGLVLVLALGLASMASAALPGTGYWIGVNVQNVGDSAASILVTAYDPDTTTEHTLNLPSVPPNGIVNFLSNGIPNGADFNPPLPSGFEGSAVISSDQPVVSQVHVTNQPAAGFGVPGGRASAIYQGVEGTQAATTVNFPLVKYNHFGRTTTFYLQNAGTAAATIQVTFNVQGGTFNHTTGSIGPNEMVAIDPGVAGVPAGNNVSLGAMTATSGQPIAGVMLEHEHAAAIGSTMQGSGSFAEGEPGNTAYCPIAKSNYFGRDTGIQVQNVHSSAQNITVTYQPGGHTATANNVAVGASVTFLNPPGLPDGLYAATVQGASGPVAAIANEGEVPLVSVAPLVTTAKCLPSAAATQELSYPIYKEQWFNRTTGLQVQNVGNAQATNVVLQFTDQNGTTYTTAPQTIAAGASKTFVCVSSTPGLWAGAAMPAASLAGVNVTADQPIIAVGNEASWVSVSPCTADNSATRLDSANGLGFNLTP